MNDDSMFFGDLSGKPVCKMPTDGEGKPLVADGKTIFSLVQAARHFKIKPKILRAIWRETFAHLFRLKPTDTDTCIDENMVERAAAKAKRSMMSMMFDDLHEDFHEAFLAQAEHCGFDPFAGDCWPKIVFRNGKQQVQMVATLKSLRAAVWKVKEFRGRTPAVFTPSDPKLVPESATMTGKRMHDGVEVEMTVQVFRRDYIPLTCDRDDDAVPFHEQSPHTWLGNVAEAALIRALCPEKLGKAYIKEELDHLGDQRPRGRRADDSQHSYEEESVQSDKPKPTDPLRTAGSGPKLYHEFKDAMSLLGFTSERTGQIVAIFQPKHPHMAEKQRPLFWNMILSEVSKDPAKWGAMPN